MYTGIPNFFGHLIRKNLFNNNSSKLNCLCIGKTSLTSSIVINVPTRASLAVETKGLLFLWLAHLNKKSNLCKQISSLLFTNTRGYVYANDGRVALIFQQH